MTATVAEARDAIFAQFKTVWDADAISLPVPVQYPDVAAGEFPPKTQDGDSDPTSWARITLIHSPGAGGQSTLSADTGQRRYERFGIVTVSIFTPVGDGLKGSDALVAIALRAFEGVRTTGTGVVFFRARPNEVGPDGTYYQTNVLVDFEYSEVR